MARPTCLRSLLSKTGMHGKVSSRLDYCNWLLAVINNRTMLKLLRVQSSLSRSIGLSNTSIYNHKFSVIKSLNWFPAQERTGFKLGFLV